MFIIVNKLYNTNVYSGKWRFHSFLSQSLEVNMDPFVFYAYVIYINYTCNWIYIDIYIPLSVFWFKKDLLYIFKILPLIFNKTVYHWPALQVKTTFACVHVCAHVYAHTHISSFLFKVCLVFCYMGFL